MSSKEQMSDWIMPALLLTPHTILLIEILNEVKSDRSPSSFDPIGIITAIIALIGVMIAAKAYSSWKDQIKTQQNINARNRIRTCLHKLANDSEKLEHHLTFFTRPILIDITTPGTGVINDESFKNYVEQEKIKKDFEEIQTLVGELVNASTEPLVTSVLRKKSFDIGRTYKKSNNLVSQVSSMMYAVQNKKICDAIDPDTNYAEKVKLSNQELINSLKNLANECNNYSDYIDDSNIKSTDLNQN